MRKNNNIIALFLPLGLSLSLLLAMTLSALSHAAIEERRFSDTEKAERYQGLISELRCLVCQNQNLADSNAELAKDLRTITANMLEAGNSDQEIKAFMSDRYGDFVLYKPPLRKDTALLWFGPVILLILTLAFLLRHHRQRMRQAKREALDSGSIENSDAVAQRDKIQELLKNSPSLDP